MSYGTTRASPAEQNGSNTAPSSQSLGGASGSSSDPAVADQDSHGNSLRLKAKAFYSRNLGLVFVFLAQIFASIMSMTTRLLATGFEPKIHALQIIFVRMLATALIGSFWMWFKKVPGFPLGPRGVRRLLVIRGVAGSVGLFGLYYSLSYLDVSEATVITFLVPTITAFVCWVALHEPFTVSEALAGLIALVGVVFIARPTFLFPPMGRSEPHALFDGASEPHFRLKGGLLPPVRASPLERSIAVGCAIAGAFCAATAYATIRIIGKRAHSLVSVNYFASTATVSSFLIIMLHPSLQFEIPTSLAQWLLLLSIGLSGFIFQILITEGLQREKAGRATNLIYTQLIFSLIIDYTVWGTTPPATSIAGSVLIIGAAVWISVQKKTTPEKRQPSTVDEESRLLPSEGPRT